MQTLSNWLRHNAGISIIMGLFFVVATTYSVVTPLFEMSDELWHYPMVKTLADGNGLPIQDSANPGPWRQEGSQPPLSYYAGAALTFWIDTSDVGEVLRPNPHVDNGVITPDGNTNLIVHNYAREAEWPWRGTVLAVHVVRLMSVVMSTTALYVTYLIGREVFPSKQWLALAGAAAVGFTPMFAFISGAVNNDNLAVLLSALGLYMMLRIIQAANSEHDTLRLAIILGLILGLSALTKASILGQFGLAGLTIAYVAFKKQRWQTFFVEGPIIVAVAIAISGWWYWRNYRLYGDPFGLNVFIEILGQRARPATYAQLWTERFGFMQSYWGLFGGVNVPMDNWIYATLNTLFVGSAVGVVVYLLKKFMADKTIEGWAPALLSLLWIAGVIVPLASYWARVTWSSQGRLVFSAIMSINLWFIAGLSAWLPDRIGRWVAMGVVSFMAIITAIAPFVYIQPSYALPTNSVVESSMDGILFTPPGAEAATMMLADYQITTTEAQPGDTVTIRLEWVSTSAMQRNWSTFVHLQDSFGFRVGQRDTYPGLGLIATSELPPGTQWVDEYVVPISASAITPEELEIRVGLWDFNTGERMTVDAQDNSLPIGTVLLEPRPSINDVPNPIRFNFGEQIQLSGYDVPERSIAPGETLTVDLYLEAIEKMNTDYTVSLQILGPDNQRFGALDRQLAPASSAWRVDILVKDSFSISLNADTPVGEYPLQVVFYEFTDDGGFERLQMVNEEGRLTDDFLILTQIRVTP